MATKHPIVLVLHAHLPFVRHPEYPRFLEERWLFEAISDTYLPLLRCFERLDTDQVPFSIALSFSPTLCQMLGDELLQTRYIAHLDRLIEFGSREVERTQQDEALNALARFYYDRAVEDRVLFTERYERNILKAFDFYHKKGRIELLCTAATHAFLPFFSAYPEAIQAQIEVALAQHRAIFGRSPHGFWLPDLAWFPEIEQYLRAYNFRYTIVDTHGLLFSEPAPGKGTFAPIQTPSGLAVFARDLFASREIWDAESGYPSSAQYRDFYRDVGYDLPADAIADFLEADGVRTATGFKYWAITGKTNEKRLYDPAAAASLAEFHAEAFLNSRADRAAKAEVAARAEGAAGDADIALCAFNAELFGHWWFEGPVFLEALFRKAALRDDLAFSTPSEVLHTTSVLQTATPEFSTWGSNGYAETWLDVSNDWSYRHILRSVDRMTELAERFPDEGGLKERALNQAAREILLSQASDWAFIMKDRSSPDYARMRLEESIRNFTTIYDSLGGNYISTEWLTQLERRHNIFPTINYRIFRKKK